MVVNNQTGGEGGIRTPQNLWQQNRVQHFGKNESAGTLNFRSRIASSICTVMLTKRVKLNAVMFKSRCSRTAVSYRFYTRDAKPLNCVRLFRLANSSPVIQRYPASRSRSVREPSGKMSCATSAQFPGNCQAVANTLPPNIRADDLQDNSQDGAQRSWSFRVAVRIAAMQHPAKHPASSTFCPHVLNLDSRTL